LETDIVSERVADVLLSSLEAPPDTSPAAFTFAEKSTAQTAPVKITDELFNTLEIFIINSALLREHNLL
jgi:hypothetical protein